MNLSSYLQMPPAPLVPNNTQNAVPQGARSGVGPSAGNNLGFDFADVMARQLQRLVPQQRQNIAADAPEQAQTTTDKQEARPAEDRRRADRSDSDTVQTNNRDAAPDNDAPSNTPTRQRNKTTPHKNQHADVDALLEGLMQGAPVASTPLVTPTIAAVTDPATATATPPAMTATTAITATTAMVTAVNALPKMPTVSSDVASAATLQTVELSPQMRIITDPKAAPSPESLAAFAKSMGLDESAIENLLTQQPATPATVLATASPAMIGPPPHALHTPFNAALGTPPQGVLPTEDSLAAQMTAMAVTTEQPEVASGTGLAAPATTLMTSATQSLPGLTSTDMAAIQQLQITVLPAAVLPVNTQAVNTATPSTLDMLSLLGTGIDDKEVSALLSRFSEETGSDSPADQPPSQDDGHHFSSFAQALSNHKNPANAAPANAAQASAANLSEVYDQLSDKMATEMAARMHKQLSDGEWKMKFALRPSNLGGVEIQLEMKDGKLDAVFRADNPLTRDLLQNSSQRLREALGNFGINAGQVNVGQGGNSQHNSSGNSNKNSQVRDNSPSQVSGNSSASNASSTRHKANASLLDLYA